MLLQSPDIFPKGDRLQVCRSPQRRIRYSLYCVIYTIVYDIVDITDYVIVYAIVHVIVYVIAYHTVDATDVRIAGMLLTSILLQVQTRCTGSRILPHRPLHMLHKKLIGQAVYHHMSMRPYNVCVCVCLCV